MNRRRVLLAVAAVVMGLAGVGFLVRYVQTSEDRALAGYELVDVYTVVQPIPLGTPASELGEKVQLTSMPAAAAAADALGDLTGLDGLVVTIDLMPGEQLLASRFDRPDEVRTVFGSAVEVPYGALEVTVKASSERAIGGQVSPGDVVAVIASFATYRGDGGTGTDQGVVTDGQEMIGGQTTGVLLRQALVTNVQATASEIFDQQDATGRSRSAPTVDLLVTLAVQPTDATRLVFANEYGTVWLAHDTQVAGSDDPAMTDLSVIFAPGEEPTGPDGSLAMTEPSEDPAAAEQPEPAADPAVGATGTTTQGAQPGEEP